MDRAEARRRRRRKGHIRLAVAVVILVVVIVVITLLVRSCACGGDATEAVPTPSPADGQTETPAEETSRAASPVPSAPPLVGLGDTVRFETPQGAIVRVSVSDYSATDEPPPGVTPGPGERIVTLRLDVTPEGDAGSAPVRLPFKKRDSFLLISEDESGVVAQLTDDGVLGASVAPGETVTTTLAFSVGAPTPIRLVCRPIQRSEPRSATWELGK